MRRLNRPSPGLAVAWGSRLFQVTTRMLDQLRMGQQTDLFGAPTAPGTPRPAASAPLAERMRPRSIDEYIGQQHLLGPGRILGALIASQQIESLILWGPPGTGKTTLAHLLAAAAGRKAVTFSAVLQGVKDLRVIIDEAAADLRRTGQATVLFVDEIHRFNKAQQDAFLPHVEAGTVTLIGATTENPSFEVIAPLLSRARVVVLEPLTEDDLGLLLDRALADPERGLGRHALSMTEDARRFLVGHAQGDARVGLGALDSSARLTLARQGTTIDLALAEEAAQQRALRYDKNGDEHYNVISAFIKSLRGSDPDAALYWMMRMLEAGEDPMFIARRLVIFAAEDIGNAEPQALQVAIAAKDAVHFVGLPEGRIPLAQAATFLACAPKSNASYRAMLAAAEDARMLGPLPVPLHLRNAPTKLMQGMGYGAGYQSAHDQDGGLTSQSHLPERLVEKVYYRPTDRGQERELGEQLAAARQRRGPRPG
jgi:putative ATPase